MRLLDSAADPLLGDMARLAAGRFGAPTAAIFVIDGGQPGTGTGIAATAETGSIAAAALDDGAPLFVADVSVDPRFAADPIAQAHAARFCAAAPVRAPDGEALGVLVVMDPKPRQPAAADGELARDIGTLAALIAEKLVRHRRNRVDEVIEVSYGKLIELSTSAIVVID